MLYFLIIFILSYSGLLEFYETGTLDKLENLNFKSNVYENILKARNQYYCSKTGLKEYMVSYLASGKAIYAGQVLSIINPFPFPAVD